MSNKLIVNTISEFKKLEGKALPNGEWFIVTQDMISDFGRITGDEQWIHVNPEMARKMSPFRKTVAHGFMSVAMLSKKLEDVFTIESLKMGLNYGLNRVRFPNPVPVDSELRLVSSIVAIEDYEPNGIKVTFNCTMEIKGVEKPACVAEFIALMFE